MAKTLMDRVVWTLLVSLLGAGVAPAQPAQQAAPQPPADTDPSIWSDVKFGATFEGYYQFNWNKPFDRVIPLRAYDTRSNSFSIQQAALVIDAAPDVEKGRRAGLRVDLQFGQATEALQGSAANEPRPDVYRNLWQAYALRTAGRRRTVRWHRSDVAGPDPDVGVQIRGWFPGARGIAP